MKPNKLRLHRLGAWVAVLIAATSGEMEARAETPAWDQALKSKWGNWALGPTAGQVVGLSAKYWELPERAIDAGAGYAWDKYFVLHADYLFQFPMAGVIPYVGGGIEYSYDTDEAKPELTVFEWMTSRKGWGGFGLRFPVGFEWIPSGKRVGVFAEFVPGIGLVPELFRIMRGGAGVRLYF